MNNLLVRVMQITVKFGLSPVLVGDKENAEYKTTHRLFFTKWLFSLLKPTSLWWRARAFFILSSNVPICSFLSLSSHVLILFGHLNVIVLFVINGLAFFSKKKKTVGVGDHPQITPYYEMPKPLPLIGRCWVIFHVAVVTVL